MNSIKVLTVCFVAGWMLVKAGSASAQIPVTDAASIATDVMNHVEDIAKYVEQISQLKAQLDQMKQQYGVDQAVVSPAAISITAMAPWRSRPNCSGLDEAA